MELYKRKQLNQSVTTRINSKCKNNTPKFEENIELKLLAQLDLQKLLLM